jgi:hypothetical protein
MTRRWIIGLAAVLTLNAALWLATAGLALPSGLASYFLGPKMVRSEVLLKDASGLHDYRLDHGRIRAITPTSLTLAERTGDVVTIQVSPTAQVTIGGRPAPYTTLRKKMDATTIRDGSAPADKVIATR